MVSPEPDIKIEERKAEDQFIVLACDGVWDVMSNDDICDFVLKNHMRYPDLGYLGAAILDECLKRNSKDNMTVNIVFMPSMTLPAGEEKKRLIEKYEAEDALAVEKELLARKRSSLDPESSY